MKDYKSQWRETPAWKRTERLAVQALRRHGIPCKLVSQYNSGFDALAENGTRIEIKHAKFKVTNGNSGQWKFSIARNGKMTEDEVDFYCVALVGNKTLGRLRTYLLIPAPIGHRDVTITVKTLLGRWNKSIDNWESVLKSERRRAHVSKS